MIGLIAGIIGIVALGCLVTHVIMLTFRWLANKIREKFAKKETQKVAVADLHEMIESCDNTMTIDQLEKLEDEGYTHWVATVDDNGKVSDVEAIKDKNDTIDEEVDRFINRTGDGMVVITR